MKTLADAIDALSEPERGFHFTSRSAPESTISHEALRTRVRSLAGKLCALGHAPGDRVVIAVPDQEQFLQLFLAVVRAGLVAVPVPPPALTGDLTAYCDDIERIRAISKAERILTTDALHQRLQPRHSFGSLISWSEIQSSDESRELGDPTADSAALIQFTSGSTGSPKGVELTHGNIIHNALAIQHALEIDPLHDRGLSWLPFHHDMGLMGFLITPVLIQASTWLLPPLEFARQPRRWLELMSQTGATISYAPNFAYEMAARSARKVQSKNWDLSSWRVAGCGGEPVMPEVLENFARQLEPAGFRKQAFAPSYGLAEATVAVTLSVPQRGVIQRCSTSGKEHNRTTVSSGRAVKDTDIRIVSSGCAVSTEGMEGDIQVRGPGVARRIWSEAGPQPSTHEDGWLDTGDQGFLIEGELHVSGRSKETIVINGRNHHAQDIEECVQALKGIRLGGVIAIGRPGEGSEQLVLIVESRSAGDLDALRHDLRATIRQKLGLAVADVVMVSHGTIERTTSGKIKRHALKVRYLAGEFTELSPPPVSSVSSAVSHR